MSSIICKEVCIGTSVNLFVDSNEKVVETTIYIPLGRDLELYTNIFNSINDGRLYMLMGDDVEISTEVEVRGYVPFPVDERFKNIVALSVEGNDFIGDILEDNKTNNVLLSLRDGILALLASPLSEMGSGKVLDLKRLASDVDSAIINYNDVLEAYKIIPTKVRRHLDVFSFINTFSVDGLVSDEIDRLRNFVGK